METPKAPATAHPEMTRIGKSFVIKGELSCSEDLYIDGQVEGTIDPKGNCLTIGPNGRVKANVNASAVVVLSRLSWKWRERSSVKIAERTYEKRAQALHC